MYWKIGPGEIVGFKVNVIEYFHHAKKRRYFPPLEWYHELPS
jgi:hypothetical protein